MARNGSLTVVYPRLPGGRTVGSQRARWLDHLAETAGAQMPKPADAASAVAEAWRASRRGHGGLWSVATEPQLTGR